MKQVDLSEAAILRRLKQADRLRAPCPSLMKAKKPSDEKTKENKPEAAKDAKRQTACRSLFEN